MNSWSSQFRSSNLDITEDLLYSYYLSYTVYVHTTIVDCRGHLVGCWSRLPVNTTLLMCR